MKNFLILLAGFFLASCSSVKTNSGEDAIQYKNIEKHIAELSSDKYMGRMPMSSTEGITVDYIAGRDDLEGVVQDARLLYKVGLNLANSTEWPGWNEGSEFKTIREESRKSSIIIHHL